MSIVGTLAWAGWDAVTQLWLCGCRGCVGVGWKGAVSGQAVATLFVAVMMASADNFCIRPAMRLYASFMALDLSSGAAGAISFMNFSAVSPMRPCSSRTNGVTSLPE